MIVGFDWQLGYKQMQFIRHCISWKHVYIYSDNLQTKWNTHQHTQHIIPLTNHHIIRLVHFYVATLNMHYNSPYLSTANQGIKVLYLLSYRHDMGMPIMQFRRSPDRSIFVMETSIHIRPVFILVQHPVYGAYVKTVIRTSITKLEQSWDRLKFIIGTPIKNNTCYGCDPRWLSLVKYDFIGIILRLVDTSWKCFCCSKCGRKWDLAH